MAGECAAGHFRQRLSHAVSQSARRPDDGALLVDYSLSRRTDVYAEGAYVSNRSFSDVGLRGTGVDIAPGMDQAGVTVGIRHTF